MRVMSKRLLFPCLRSRLLVLLVPVLLLGAPQVLAQVVPVPAPQAMIPAAPQIAVKSWILMDADSGRVLVEHNADERLTLASLTNLMTVYLSVSAQALL